MQFRYVLLSGMLAAALLPAAAFSLWQFGDVRERIAVEDARQVRLAGEAAAVVAQTVENATRAVLVAAYSASIPLSEQPTPALVRTLGETLRRIALSQPVIENLHIDDATLKSRIFWPLHNDEGASNLNMNHADRWHAGVLERSPGTAAVSPVFLAKGAFEGLTVNIAAAIPPTGHSKETNGRETGASGAVGVVSAALRLGEFGRLMQERLTGTDLSAVLFDEAGRVIFPLEGASRDRAAAIGRALGVGGAGAGPVDKRTHAAGSEKAGKAEKPSARTVELFSVPSEAADEKTGVAQGEAASYKIAYVRAALPQGAPDWTVVLYREASARTAEMTVLQHRALAWVGLVLFMTTLVSAGISTGLSRAVEKLSRFLESRRSVPVEAERIRFPRELADFQAAYAETKAELDRNEVALRALNAELHAAVRARTAELEARRATLEALFDGMAEGVVLFDSDCIAAMNREAKRFFPTLAYGDAASAVWAQLGLKAAPQSGSTEIVKTPAGVREVLRFEVRAKGSEGEELGGALAAKPEAESDASRLEGLLIRDVTAREEVAQLKENLLGMAAHELKTPIQTLSLEVEMLGRVDSDAERAPILNDLAESVRHLKTLVHDWLDVARIEGGVFSVVKAPVQLPLIVRRAARMTHARYPFQTVEWHFEEEAECLLGDGERLLQLFSNLLVNAARYRQLERGSSVRVEGVRRGDMIEIAIDDDGIGIAPENREKVFERFFQVDATNRRRSGGTGQGLVIARAICRAHGGDIRVEASRRPEGGSRFIVTLPAFALESVAASPL